jgi:hypothetical protein
MEMNELIIEKSFAYLRTIENVSNASMHEKEAENFKHNDIVWKVITEIELGNNEVSEIELYVKIEGDYPLSIPKIYLSNIHYEQLKYIPHIDTNRSICIFDEETSRPNPEEFELIIPECIIKAKRIIFGGISKANFIDFEEEFLAYWKGKYFKKDIFPENFLCIFNADSYLGKVYVIETEISLGGYKYFFHQNDNEGDRLKGYLNRLKRVFKEYECFYIDEIKIDFTPPFKYDNNQVLNFINQNSRKEFENFINLNTSTSKIVLTKVSVLGKMVFIGWVYQKLYTNRKGFRTQTITPFYVMNTFQKRDKVLRIAPQIFTRERLARRTSGQIAHKNWCFLVAGLGSIGSHLIHFLNLLNYPCFKLIDKDILVVENIGRHLLGLSYVSQHKTLAIRNYLQLNFPTQKIETKEDFIQSVLNDTPEFVNNCDYIFLTTGNTNVENWIGEKIGKGTVTKPVFFIWIEPYLCGGHCIYIHPKSHNYSNYFTESGYLKYNIIAEDYYANLGNALILKEGGCQTSYIPYSASDVSIFVSSLFSKICNIIENNIIESKSYTWIGSNKTLIEKGIKMSEYANTKNKGDLIENIL